MRIVIVGSGVGAKEKPPLDLLKQWIDESYRAVAPKTLVALRLLLAGGADVDAVRRFFG